MEGSDEQISGRGVLSAHNFALEHNSVITFDSTNIIVDGASQWHKNFLSRIIVLDGRLSSILF